jgi:hypothetical protein
MHWTQMINPQSGAASDQWEVGKTLMSEEDGARRDVFRMAIEANSCDVVQKTVVLLGDGAGA